MSRGAAIALAAVVALAAGGGGWWWWTKWQKEQAMIETLRKIMPAADPQDVADFAPAIVAALERYEINTPRRRQYFLAQIAEESDQLWHLRDHYRTPRGEEYADGTQYEDRGDLGNTQDGAGARFKGRGLLQITGRVNYQAMGEALGIDLIASPELLNEPKWAALAAGQFWSDHECNELSDAGNFKAITRRINGGLNGMDARLAFLSRAQSEGAA